MPLVSDPLLCPQGIKNQQSFDQARGPYTGQRLKRATRTVRSALEGLTFVSLALYPVSNSIDDILVFVDAAVG